MTVPDEVRYERAAELLEAELGDELVALEPDAGTCFGFNNVAAAVWRRLSSPKSLSELSAELSDEYEVSDEECRSDVAALLDELLSRKLVRVKPK